MLKHVRIAGVKVATASRAELTAAMVSDCLLRAKSDNPVPPRLVFDTNGQAISMSACDTAYRATLEGADIIHADGGFIVTASRWLAGARIAERSATTDLIHDFAAAAVANDLSFYLLGGGEEVNAACAERLRELYPGLRIVGRRNGYFSPTELEDVIREINEAKPHLLWLGLGKPLEQLFATRNARTLRAGWAVTCGGCFNYISGHYRRAPEWMRRANLEWLYRAFTERRLFWRYLSTTPHALWLTLTKPDRTIYPGAFGRKPQ